ncbi:hypothetical protein GQ457_03G017150 [Hibiscus cannabinus]
MKMIQARLVYCSFGINCQCFYFFYKGGFDILLQLDDKGDASTRDNGSGLGRLSRLESDLGRASCRVIGLCLSQNNCLA